MRMNVLLGVSALVVCIVTVTVRKETNISMLHAVKEKVVTTLTISLAQ